MNSIEEYLPRIIKSLKATHGSDFFNSLTIQLDKTIGADYTFIAKLDREKYVSRTICLVAKGEIIENFEYSLANTPCASVAGNTVCIYPENICAFYPKDQLLIDMKVEGYVGAPLFDSLGKVIGIVVALYETKIENPDFIVSLFELFSGRISAEIEREEKEQELIHFNKNLERLIKERTVELSNAIENLKFTQDKLIEQEKMASLGHLVAGIAHEINTPLGVAVLSCSNIHDSVAELYKRIKNNTLKKSELEHQIDIIISSEESLAFNLQRAAGLVSNFKQIAVDRNTDELTNINFNAWLSALVGSLMPMLKQQNIQVEVEPTDDIIPFTTYPSQLSQVIANLISNSAVHAFDDNNLPDPKIITISFAKVEDNLQLIISDNGKGIANDKLKKIFEPFYTTKRGQGGTGLGLSIVNNIISAALDGEIIVQSTLKKGTKFTLNIPNLKKLST